MYYTIRYYFFSEQISKMDDLDSVILNLKACLVSTKGGIQLSQIESKLLKYFFHLNN